MADRSTATPADPTDVTGPAAPADPAVPAAPAVTTGPVTAETAARWYRRFHPNDTAAVRLVCFPHAGGTAGYYHPFSAKLSRRADVLAAQYPGRQDRLAEPGLTSVDALAEELHRQLRPYADRPLAFFGHSMGATLAFEVARRIGRDGLPAPVRLFLSGRRAPSLHREEEPAHRLSDADLLGRLADLGGTDRRLLADPELCRLVVPAIRSDYTAIETHRGGAQAVLPVPITALTGDADPRATPEDMHSWAAHTTAGLEVKVLPGGHFYLAEQVSALTELFAGRLAGVTATC